MIIIRTAAAIYVYTLYALLVSSKVIIMHKDGELGNEANYSECCGEIIHTIYGTVFNKIPLV